MTRQYVGNAVWSAQEVEIVAINQLFFYSSPSLFLYFSSNLNVGSARDVSQSHKRFSRHLNSTKKRKGINIPHTEDPTMSLLESLTESYVLICLLVIAN